MSITIESGMSASPESATLPKNITFSLDAKSTGNLDIEITYSIMSTTGVFFKIGNDLLSSFSKPAPLALTSEYQTITQTLELVFQAGMQSLKSIIVKASIKAVDGSSSAQSEKLIVVS